jgi:hypothetical protein
MSLGMSVYDSSGLEIWDTSGILARLVGYGTISFAALEFTTKTITITGYLSTDIVVISNINNSNVIMSVTLSAPNVSIQRTNSLGGAASSHLIQIFRTS